MTNNPLPSSPALPHPAAALPSRRSVLKGLGAGVSLSAVPFGLASAAMAQTGPRSLVCIFLYGGADSFNMVVPRNHSVAGQDHATYQATRGSFALPANQLLGIHDGDFGLHPGLDQLAAIADSGRLAVVNNMGPLTQPTTRTQFLNQVSVPQFLFAHNAQQKLWQTARPLVSYNSGWGGSIAARSTGSSPVPPAFSISGSVPWLSSLETGYSRLSATVGIERLRGYDASLRSWIPSFEGLQNAMEDSLSAAASSTNPFDRAAAASLAQSVVTTEQLQEATQQDVVGMEGIAPTSLGGRLRTVAQLIASRDALGQSRQVFFVGMGGWDTHGEQAERFPVLLAELNEAIGAFQDAMDTMGAADSVTAFTSTDFGRTLTSNGDGTDHAWGGNAFVWGGAVNEGRYGQFPNLSTTNNPDDTGDDNGNFAGRLIPTTSVSQYGATFARWMGLSDTEINNAFPELSNFSTPDLGFLS